MVGCWNGSDSLVEQLTGRTPALDCSGANGHRCSHCPSKLTVPTKNERFKKAGYSEVNLFESMEELLFLSLDEKTTGWPNAQATARYKQAINYIKSVKCFHFLFTTD